MKNNRKQRMYFAMYQYSSDFIDTCISFMRTFEFTNTVTNQICMCFVQVACISSVFMFKINFVEIKEFPILSIRISQRKSWNQ